MTSTRYSTCDNPACFGHELRGHVLRCDQCGRTTVIHRDRAQDAAKRAARNATKQPVEAA